jgi:hypothetical protein
VDWACVLKVDELDWACVLKVDKLDWACGLCGGKEKLRTTLLSEKLQLCEYTDSL